MRDFRMKLQAVETTRLVGHAGNRTGGGGGHAHEAGRQRDD
jgi:hypothetical protein